MQNLQPLGLTSQLRVTNRSLVPLIDIYQSLFEAIPATTPELLREVYKLRYQVYCVENPFEDPAVNPGGIETDEYDSHSVHGLLIHRPTGLPAGTIRLVLPLRGRRSGSLPFHTVCRDLASHALPLNSMAELSRFAVSKKFRRRLGDELYGRIHNSDEGIDSRRIVPHITLGLMAVALRMAHGRGIDHFCAVMEPALLRLLARLGIHFTPVGPMVEYHGRRQPCVARIDKLVATIGRERYDVWEVLTDQGRFSPEAQRPADGSASLLVNHKA